MASSSEASLSIAQAVAAYLDAVRLSRRPNTARTYRNALQAFLWTLKERGVDVEAASLSTLSEDMVLDFLRILKRQAPSTERLYLTALVQFYEYVVARWERPLNLARVRLLIRQHARRPGRRLPQFPYQAIEEVLAYVDALGHKPAQNPRQHLQNLRDRAFLWTLAHTGLRVHEACQLRRGDLDWNTGHAVIIGKGDRQDVVRFSSKVLALLRDYLQERQSLDARSHKALKALPLFARHDKRAGNRVLPMSTVTGRNIVRRRVGEALGPEMVGRITPHDFRHYFVTRVLKGSGGNLKLAQRLARHQNIQVTQRYAHLDDQELDRAYREIFGS